MPSAGALLPATLPVGSVHERYLVLVVGDPERRLQALPVRAELSAGELVARCELLDDGVAPDAQKGDSVHTCALAGYPRGEVLATLTDAGGHQLWQDVVPIEGLMSAPRIAALLTGTHVRIALDTVGEIDNGREEEVEPPATEQAVDPMAGELQPDELHPVEMPSPMASSQPSAGSAGPLALLGAAALGFLAGLAAPPSPVVCGA